MYGIPDGNQSIAISASKRAESDFKAPLSTTVLDGSRILRSGATNVPEALRLVPGLIVREVSNGVYTVHIRGIDNVPPLNRPTTLNNRLILLMINGQSMYDYFDGGINWSALPVSVENIDRIEVIRGPASALYGTNAVQGVIHIFTRKGTASRALEISTNQGSSGLSTLQGAMEGLLNDTSWRFSGFRNERDRHDEQYYIYADQQYRSAININIPSAQGNPFPEPDRAMESQGLSLRLNNPEEYIFHYDIGLTHQEASSHRMYLYDETPLSDTRERSNTLNARVQYGQVDFRASYQDGDSETSGLPDFTTQKKNTQASIEYSYRLPHWVIRPGISYEKSRYRSDYLGGKKTLETRSALLRSEYRPTPEARIVAALRYDDYRRPSDGYFSYQLLGSYALDPQNLLRAGVMTANRSAFMTTHYLELQFPVPGVPDRQINIESDPEAELTKGISYEIGWRSLLQFNHWFEIEAYYTELEDFSAYVNQGTTNIGGTDIDRRVLQNLPVRAKQLGLMFNWGYEGVSWDITANASWQDTRLHNQPDNLSSPLSTSDIDSQSTPEWYGGIDISWRPHPKWDLNSQMYFMKSYALLAGTPDPLYYSPSRWILNLSARHTFSTGVTGSMGVRNLSNSDSPQSHYTDPTDPYLWLGLQVRWED